MALVYRKHDTVKSANQKIIKANNGSFLIIQKTFFDETLLSPNRSVLFRYKACIY